MDSDFIDPFGDDSDILEGQSRSGEESGFCTNPEHDHFMGIDQSLVPDDIKALPKLIPFVQLSHMVNDIAHKTNSQQEEQEAIIYTLIQVVGKEQFDKNLEAARHHQRSLLWTRVAEIYDSVLNSDVFQEVEGSGAEDSMMSVILRTNLETSTHIAKINRDKHVAAFEEFMDTYDREVITPNYSFREWEIASQKFMDELKTTIGSIFKTINKIFDKIHGKSS